MVNVELIILGMIYSQPSHGYLLKKNIKDYFGNPYFKLNNNVLYSTLAKLEKNGYIQGKEIAGEKLKKKVYHITEDGEKYFLQLVATPVEPDLDKFEFHVKAVFFDLIPKESRLEVIKPWYEASLQMYQDALEKKKSYSSKMLPISLIVLEYGIKDMENTLEFYRNLMNME